MVNGWLKLGSNAVDIRQCPLTAPKRAHFRHENCVNQHQPTRLGRSEVVLAQAILGLLINRTAASPRGIKE
jgi:hypothetical protein